MYQLQTSKEILVQSRVPGITYFRREGTLWTSVLKQLHFKRSTPRLNNWFDPFVKRSWVVFFPSEKWTHLKLLWLNKSGQFSSQSSWASRKCIPGQNKISKHTVTSHFTKYEYDLQMCNIHFISRRVRYMSMVMLYLYLIVHKKTTIRKALVWHHNIFTKANIYL